MKKIKALKISTKAKEISQATSSNHRKGITERLLAKYKPTGRFTVVNGNAPEACEAKAA